MADGEKIEKAVIYDGIKYFGSVTATGVKGIKPKILKTNLQLWQKGE